MARYCYVSENSVGMLVNQPCTNMFGENPANVSQFIPKTGFKEDHEPAGSASIQQFA